MSTPEFIPDFVGPYRVLGIIGKGGFGAVYRVEEPETGRHLALKHHVRTGRAARRFRQEFALLGEFDHPALPRPEGWGEDPEIGLWLAMEEVEGEPALRYVNRGGPPGAADRQRRAMQVLHGLAEVLAWLHARGVVHCDIKSGNVLAAPGGEVHLVDLGAARRVGVGGAAPAERFVGTRSLAPPELLEGQPVDGRTDLYLWGVLARRLLGDPPTPLIDLVGQCLALDVADRPLSAMTLLDALPDVVPPLSPSPHPGFLRAWLDNGGPGATLSVVAHPAVDARAVLDRLERDGLALGFDVLRGPGGPPVLLGVEAPRGARERLSATVRMGLARAAHTGRPLVLLCEDWSAVNRDERAAGVLLAQRAEESGTAVRLLTWRTGTEPVPGRAWIGSADVP